MKILILHGIRELRELRRTTLNQSFCLLKFAPEHDYTLHCYGHEVTPELRQSEFDTIVLDTSFLWSRWARPRAKLADLLDQYRFVAASQAVKIALPQDDYDHCAILDEWLADWRVDAVFTPLAQHAELLYPRTSLRAQIRPCFAGHLDPGDRAIANRFRRPFENREIDVEYRAADLPAQFGRLGRLKSEIGHRFARALGRDSRLRLDISTDRRDALAADKWLRFLCNSRFTLGSASGSSLLDPKGLIADAIQEHLTDHPNASFEEIEAACFPGLDGNVELAGLGPRNIETALAESCQILVPSPHLAPFEPDVHYIPLAPDCSNVEEVLHQMQDRTLVQRRIDAALGLVLETPSFRTDDFARRILGEVDRLAPSRYSKRGNRLTPRRQDAVDEHDPVHPLLAEQEIIIRLAAAECRQLQTDLTAANEKYAARPDAAEVEKYLNVRTALELRTGARGALRELIGINNAIQRDGSIDILARRTLALRSWLALRSFRDGIFAGIANISQTKEWLAELHRRSKDLPPGFGSGRVVTALRDRQHLSMRRLGKMRTLPPREVARRPITALRRTIGIPVAAAKTVTMLVADTRVDRRVLLSARSLQRAGWLVEIIALPYPEPIDDDRRMFPELSIRRIRPLRLPAIGQTRSELAKRAREWQSVYPYYLHFLELARRYPGRVFVAHDLPVLASAAVAAEESGCYLAYDAHELYPEQHLFSAERSASLGRAEADLISRADLVTTVNGSIATEMAERYGIDCPAIILNCPAAPAGGLPVPCTNLLRDHLALDQHHCIVLFQGGLSPNRNLEALVDAMSMVRRGDVVLVFLGPDGGTRSTIVQIARAHGLLGGRVRIVDPVAQDVLLSWTASADIGIIPYPPIDLNSRLCTPNKLFEYIVAEVPILANDLPEIRKFVAGNGFGVVHPMISPEAIAAAIDDMAGTDLSGFRATLRARAAEFTWDRQELEIIRLYAAFEQPRAFAVPPTRAFAQSATVGEDGFE
jgi:glycosyltransferase involved in cell wall biosynthesis